MGSLVRELQAVLSVYLGIMVEVLCSYKEVIVINMLKSLGEVLIYLAFSHQSLIIRCTEAEL